MDLGSRPGLQNMLPHSPPRLPSGVQADDVNVSFPDDASCRCAYRGAEGPVLEEVKLGPLMMDGHNERTLHYFGRQDCRRIHPRRFTPSDSSTLR